MESHNCLSCRALISTLFFYCWQCRQERAKRAKDARQSPIPGQSLPGDVFGYWRPW